MNNQISGTGSVTGLIGAMSFTSVAMFMAATVGVGSWLLWNKAKSEQVSLNWQKAQMAPSSGFGSPSRMGSSRRDTVFGEPAFGSMDMPAPATERWDGAPTLISAEW